MIDILRSDLDAMEVVRRLDEKGVALLPAAPHRVRAVTHADVDERDIDRAIEVFRAVLS